MLKEIFEKLDDQVIAANKRFADEGSFPIPKFQVQVLGQVGLLEAQIDIPMNKTIDLDAYSNMKYSAKRIFIGILAEYGLVYDDLSDEIWMPKETVYNTIFEGQIVTGMVAQPEYILLSKAIKAPDKNRTLLARYLGHKPSKLFISLCDKYGVDLKELLDGE